jgi:hypothetical protein
MTNQELGSSFEIITKDFFVWILEKIGFTVTKARAQKSGSQNGFDIQIMVSKDYFEHTIWIECKNYESDLAIGNLVKKGLNLESNYDLNENDLFIAINPRSNFSNDDNSEKLSPILRNKFPFSYYALDLSNGIKELFALNNTFYKRLYGYDVDFVIDEEKEINRFKSIIFSRKPFKKIIINENDKTNFIGDIKYDNYCIERSFSEEIKSDFLSWNEKEGPLTLTKILGTQNKIFIIGNPGNGKSTELKKLALLNWKTGEVDGYVPIFKSLKNFTNTDEISNYLPKDWEKLNNIFFILDGIDEISDIEYFKSKLETFIIANDNKSKNYKFIISCRTNVFQSIVKEISNFKVYYLKDLTYYQSLELLKNKCGDIIDSFRFDDMIANFLRSPFQINILANYINEKKKFPSNTAELWKTYIDSRLSTDENDKLKKVSLNIPVIEEFSKKASLVNELMKTNIIDENNIFKIVKKNSNDFKEFKKNPLFELQANSKNWNFEHRNLQEYFAASSLSELDFVKIKNFIFIDKTNRTHPLLFNTITFLINVLDENTEKFEKLVDYLVINEPELLFKTDSNRITEKIRIKVFKHYFQIECIDKTFWISKSKTFTVKEIAEFGDCEENFDYLNLIINNEKNHFRIITSSLELLSFFTIPLNKKDKFKNDLLNLLERKSISDSIKSHILDCIDDQKFHIDDFEYLNKIFALFRFETSKEINRALLSLLKDYEPIDKYFWYIKEEFLRDKRIRPRKIKDDVIRGNSWVLEKIIIRLQNSSNFIYLVKYYFDETKNNYSDNRFAEEVIERCLFFENNEDDFLVRLLASFEEKEKYYLRENLLKTLILKSSINSQIKAFNYLIENFTFNNVGYFLASITTKETISVIIKKFIDGSIETKELDFFRNVIANHGNRELAGQFNNIMVDNGYIFNQPFLFEKEYQDLKNKYENKPQDNFDILFNRPKLLSKIKDIFAEYGDSIKPEIIREIDLNWYEKNGHGNKIDTAYSLLTSLVYKKKKALTFIDVEEILKNEFILIKEIEPQIKSLNDINNKFIVKDEQLAFIYQWFKNTSEEIRFDRIMQFININRFTIGDDYEKLKTVLFFMSKFNFDLPQEFLLNSIEFFDVENSDAENNNFETLKLKIDNDVLFNKRVIENLLNKKLFSFLLDKHIQYALDNNFTMTFFKIKNYFLMEGFNYNFDKKLEQYFKLTNDTELLKELCSDVKSHGCWSVIKILMDSKIEDDLCVKKAIEYLETEINDEKSYYYSNALAVLFELKSLEALKYFNLFLNLDNIPSLKESSFANYDIIEDYNVLEDLFNKIYMGDRDKIGYSGVSNFLTTYISNLSRTEEGHDKTMSKLKEIKTKIEKTETDNGLFYINILIDDSQNSYINSKSKPLSFNEALIKVEEILS